MAEVMLSIGGRAYKLACRDGEEPALRAAGHYLDSKSSALVEGLGALGEARLLLMAALQVTGELLDERRGAPPPASAITVPGLEALVARAEALAEQLSHAASPGRA